MGKINSLDSNISNSKRRSFFAGNVDAITSSPEAQPSIAPVAPASPGNSEVLASELKGRITQIHIDSLIVHEHQSRRHFDQDKLKELSQSIKSNGVITPLKVIQRGSKFEVASGERRLRAARMVGVEHLPCLVIDDRQAVIESVLENLQRENLNIFEEGRDYLKLLESGVYQHQKDMADGLGVKMSRISEVINFYKKISTEDQDRLVKENKVSRQNLRNFIEGSSISNPGPSFTCSISIKGSVAVSKLSGLGSVSESDKLAILGEIEKIKSLITLSEASDR